MFVESLPQDGTVVTWGGTDHGGNSCPMQDRTAFGRPSEILRILRMMVKILQKSCLSGLEHEPLDASVDSVAFH